MCAIRKIRKAVFPVAGLGTRFLPATKANPKEMLPVVDKPLIQYAVEEAIAAGITDIIFITGRNKRSIEDHFDTAHEIENALQAKGDVELLQRIQNITPPGVSCIYIRQPRPLGLGHAVLCAASVVGEEPFAVLLADDFIDGAPTALEEMCALYYRYGASILGVERIAREESYLYGMVATSSKREGLPMAITGIVEKPKPQDSPSDLAVVGRYILTPRIFTLLQQLKHGAGGEIQLTDAIAALLKVEEVLALPFSGVRYDCGQKLGLLQAAVTLGRKHPEIGVKFEAYLRHLFKS